MSMPRQKHRGRIYCEECSKLFCGTCVKLHDTLFKKHATLDKGNISQWPDTNVDALEQCQEHKKQQLTGFSDRVKDLHQKGNFKKLSETLDTLNVQLIQKKDDFEESMKSLEQSYNTILEEIKALRKKINVLLDELEKNTIKELDPLLATMKKSIQTDIDNCTESIKHMTCVQEDWLRRKDKSEAVNFIMYRKCLDQSLRTKTLLQAKTTQNERTLTFNPDTTIQQTLSTLMGLGQIITKVKQTQTAKIKSLTLATQFPFNIAIQVMQPNNHKMYSVRTATGKLLITDYFNNSVKLLNQNYKVVAH
ncbi:hypothetical protein DPMN_067310 [Dreissena polymorpha]|uniref:B box-type domain-containing protein n=1 Tax=Dreissena polymorpha TaxID=45954 RepID=A0A9D3YZ05_DREPO|nr:hypothetical protein DPMN_067310 [Dreissena polymorpha]